MGALFACYLLAHPLPCLSHRKRRDHRLRLQAASHAVLTVVCLNSIMSVWECACFFFLGVGGCTFRGGKSILNTQLLRPRHSFLASIFMSLCKQAFRRAPGGRLLALAFAYLAAPLRRVSRSRTICILCRVAASCVRALHIRARPRGTRVPVVSLSRLLVSGGIVAHTFSYVFIHPVTP